MLQDSWGHVSIVNERARRLLGITPDTAGKVFPAEAWKAWDENGLEVPFSHSPFQEAVVSGETSPCRIVRLLSDRYCLVCSSQYSQRTNDYEW